MSSAIARAFGRAPARSLRPLPPTSLPAPALRSRRWRKLPDAAWATGDVLASRARRCWIGAGERGRPDDDGLAPTASSEWASARNDGRRCLPADAADEGLPDGWAAGGGRAMAVVVRAGGGEAWADLGVLSRYESLESSDDVEADRSSAGTSYAPPGAAAGGARARRTGSGADGVVGEQ